MLSFLSDSVAQPRLTTWLLASFALLGILLASVGLYGVMSYGITQRTHEIGIRMALGAQRRYVFRMLVKETLLLVTGGIACGLGAAFGATRLMRGLLFGVAPSDPATYVVSALTLILTALIAAYPPARRATYVDPLKALRHE
jgi:putative ABC transport system permease protein